MPKIDEHLKWCLKDQKRLRKMRPDLGLAKKHIEKSEYNYRVLQTLEKLRIYDWALNVGFYAIYHCFLAVLVAQFDTLDFEKNTLNPTVRESRETSTYGVETSIDLNQLKKIKELTIKVQRETIRILGE